MKNAWVIPCNVKVFDVVEHFKESDTICWKRGAGEVVGDDVYVYVGIPYKAIMYKCVVENDDVDEQEMKDHPYATVGNVRSFTRYMKIRKVYTFEEPISIETIKELGIYMIRKQTRVDKKLLQHLQDAEGENA